MSIVYFSVSPYVMYSSVFARSKFRETKRERVSKQNHRQLAIHNAYTALAKNRRSIYYLNILFPNLQYQYCRFPILFMRPHARVSFKIRLAASAYAKLYQANIPPSADCVNEGERVFVCLCVCVFQGEVHVLLIVYLCKINRQGLPCLCLNTVCIE